MGGVGEVRRWRASVARAGVALALVLALVTIGLGAPPTGAADAFGRPPAYPFDGPDPSVLRVGGTYYAYTTNARLLRVQVLASEDLVHWRQVGEGLPAVGSWAEDRFGMVWAPTVIAIGGGYRLYYTAPDRFSGRQCIGTATSASPAGPFVDNTGSPVVCQRTAGGSIDPSVFDAGGARYLLWKNDGNAIGATTFIWSQQLSASGAGLVGGPTPLLAGDSAWERGNIEGPAMVAEGGQHVLIYSGGQWDRADYAMGYATCAGPTGPCTKRTSAGPWLAANGHGVGTGGGEVVRDPLGRLWMAYHAWTGGVGYEGGGVRSMFVERLVVDGGVPVARNDLTPGGAGDPGGALDGLSTDGPGAPVALGWAIDPDGAWPVDVHVYADGRFVSAVRADQRRDDVAAAYPLFGAAHGFRAPLPGLAAGRHTVCAYAINVGYGAYNTQLGCAELVVAPVSPALAASADGRLELFAVDSSGGLLHRWQLSPGGPWSPWRFTGVHTASEPVVTTSADGRLELFALDLRGGLVHSWQTSVNGSWSPWTFTGAFLADPPVVATNADGRLELFARDVAGGLVQRWQVAPDGTWSPWRYAGIPTTARPALGQDPDGRLEVFARDWRGGLVQSWQVAPGATWSPWTWTGMDVVGAATVAADADGRLELFARRSDGWLVQRWQVAMGGTWSGWRPVGLSTAAPVRLGRHGDGRLELFALDWQGGLVSSSQLEPNGGWSGFSWRGVFAGAPPALAAQPDGTLVVVDVAPTGALWGAAAAPGAAGWGSWAALSA